MREKLLKLMETEHLTASRLAELLGIRSSGISHILSERNKPSFDLLQKILKRFPNINPDWLLLDSDQMYRDQAAATRADQSDDNLFSFDNPEQTSAPTFAATENNDLTMSSPSVGTSQIANNIQQMARSGSRNVKRVIVLFDDHTFESYDMK